MKNMFASRLRYLLKLTGLKNASIASMVEYDVSYISKWVSGKMLPSDKNIEDIITKICEGLLESGKQDKLLKEYDCDESVLSLLLYEDLLSSFNKSKPNDEMPGIDPNMTMLDLYSSIDKRMHTTSQTTSILDLLSLQHEERLRFAGIQDARFDDDTKKGRYDLVIDLDKSKDAVYDAIFLVHMLTRYSDMDFRLYHHEEASGKLLYVMDNTAVSCLLFSGEPLNVSKVSGDIRKIKEMVDVYLGQENLIFKKTSIKEMRATREYAKSLISANTKWILGHISELLLPEDVYEEVLSQASIENKEACRELYRLSQNVLLDARSEIMIYDTAISNLLVSKELDFYNTGVLLNNEQLLKCMQYFKTLVEKGMSVRLIEGGLSNDFKYITNPCVFLTDSICYLRLENNMYHDNIYVFHNRKVKDLFFDFYQQVWNHREDVVISKKEDIVSRISHYIGVADTMNK